MVRALVLLSLLVTMLVILTPLRARASTAPFFQTPYDTVPNFAQSPTIRSRASGDWDDASTWDLMRVPIATDVVAVVTGHTVTVSKLTAVAKTIGIWEGALLSFDPHQNTRLKVGTLLVMPGGALEMGTKATSIDRDKTAEIVIADQPLHTVNDGLDVYDPVQYGTGLLSLGRVTMHSAPKGPSFARVAQDPRAGDTSLVLEVPVTGWLPGNQLFLPDTRHLKWNETGDNYQPQGEELELVSVTAGGATLNLRQPLAFDHLWARDGDGRQDYLPANQSEEGRIWFRPHVMNRTRNVLFRSENPAGTRGHLWLAYRAEVDTQYAHFQDIGRTKTFEAVDNTTFDDNGDCNHVGTNQMGRYAVHLHHLVGPLGLSADQPQFTIVGDSVDSGPNSTILKWAIDIHDSHYGW